ncbi:MAG: ion transporter [Saprospiraceae bacterium]|nr:ion transporter [Saprospiraceae bacterium]
MFRRLFLPEQNMMLAAIINSIIIALLYFPSLETNTFLHLLDYFFIVFFLLEAAIKIKELGWEVYWKSGWNRFDFLVVLFSLPSLLVNYLPIPDTSIFLLLRLIRLVRLVRLIRFFFFHPHMGKILDGWVERFDLLFLCF